MSSKDNQSHKTNLMESFKDFVYQLQMSLNPKITLKKRDKNEMQSKQKLNIYIRELNRHHYQKCDRLASNENNNIQNDDDIEFSNYAKILIKMKYVDGKCWIDAYCIQCPKHHNKHNRFSLIFSPLKKQF